MGYYATTCPSCGGPAIFYSFGPSIDCAKCRKRLERGPECAKLQAWVDREVGRGLVDIKFDLGPEAGSKTLEELAAAVNRALATKGVDITNEPL